MVTLSMSRSAGGPNNRRASSPPVVNLPRIPFRTQRLASLLLSIHYKPARTQESHLFPAFSRTSRQFLGPHGWVGVPRISETLRHLLTQLRPAIYTHPSLRTRHR